MPLRPGLRGLALALCLLAGPLFADEADLRAFAARVGLDDARGFAETVETIRRTGRLPDRYLTKDEARDEGWRPGDDLCDAAPGAAIGGDRFGNREGRLPRGDWREADLDFDCGRRGAKRLVFSNDGRVFVTVDHYESFQEAPE
ncbi:MAG: hypothetical protein KDG89_07820 [Geminicoccaceae bacterium]|nr:hypothetical protein [Geminicoccaceae bacterium]